MVCHCLLWGGLGIVVFGAASSEFRLLALAAPDSAAAIDAVDPANQGGRIHLSGALTADSPVGDPQFGVIGNAACLRRREEVRAERKRSERGSRSIIEVWSPSPGGRPESPRGLELRVGAFRVRWGDARQLGLRSESINGKDGPANGMVPYYRAYLDGEWIVLESTCPLSAQDAFPPAFRVKFEQIPLGAATIVGKEDGQVIYPVAMQSGLRSPDAVVQDAAQGARLSGWLMRIIGSCMAFAGLHLLSQSRDLIRLYGPDYFDD